jgi:hypothetical protein
MNSPSDLQRFQELVEASAHRELTDVETAFIGRSGFRSAECRQWLETDAEAVAAAIEADPMGEVPAATPLDWARVDGGLRRAGALPDSKSPARTRWPLLPAAAALILCIGVIYAIQRDGLSTTLHSASEVVAEVLDLPDGDGSLILHEGDDEGVLMIILSNG